MWSMEWIALSGFRNNKNIVAGLKCPTPSTPHPRLHPSTPSRVNVKWHRQTDSIVDVLSVHWEHKEAAQMVKQRLCSYFLGWEREEGREGEIEKKKGLHATPAFILGCMASCYSNMTLHSFSPAVFDQFSLLLLPRQPSFVLKCLTTAADLPPLF